MCGLNLEASSLSITTYRILTKVQYMEVNGKPHLHGRALAEHDPPDDLDRIPIY